MGKIVSVRKLRSNDVERLRKTSPGWEIVHGEKELRNYFD